MDSSEFYAVFLEASHHVEGDERSRTHPGHGYPAHDVKYTSVVTFVDQEGLKAWIRENQGKTFRAVKGSYLTVTSRLEVDLKIAGRDY